jgi:hypothetical protein
MLYALEYSNWQKFVSRHSRIRWLKRQIVMNAELGHYFAIHYPKNFSKPSNSMWQYCNHFPTYVLCTQKFANYMLYNHPEIYFTWMNLDLMYLTYTNDVEEALYAAIASKRMIKE